MSGAQRLFGDDQRRARLAVRHRLAAGRAAATCEEVVDALAVLHATDPATVFLTVGARLADPAAVTARMEAALYGPASTLTRMLAMRRTMFVVPREAAPDVFAAAGQQIAARERKKLLQYLAEGGGWDEKWLAAAEAEVEAALAELGDSSGAELSRHVARLREKVTVARGKPYETTQNVASRIIRTMAAEGRIERRRPAGSWMSGQFRWARAEPLPARPVPQARAAVVRAWLAAYGPGTAADLKWWTGWGLGEVGKALDAVGAETVRLEESGEGFVLPGDSDGATAEDAPAAVLLPGLDPTPMGWQRREWFLPEEHRAALFDGTGNVGPTVWWGGEVIGGWGQRADCTVVWRRLADRGADADRAVDAAAAELTARLAGVQVTPRFRTPLERELAS
ncbi:Winged helix DNA-binding domain-containing protein [Actinacidiphila yanglinensis]|uniref:Winged helix DNA-binding domain-containing protein n=1 Tax=Actinacidiphila yanglinensis TaxID=310779 RepID=A0A1H5ZDM6_9ACTN|nr:winged helix DNA-binding domain-containing protein [Actinacidiphila yanglinensis]SEG33466.1 Winged helix DNA-binding domain-containing protein [Actinacidiphila yanglinensis]